MVRATALGGVVLLLLVQMQGDFLPVASVNAQTSPLVDHRIIAGVQSSQGYCFDWQDTGNGYGPGCWHQDEGGQLQWDALDISAGGVQAGAGVLHQEYGLLGSVNLKVTAINPCGRFDTGTDCGGGTGCSYVYIQMRDVSTDAVLGEEHYLHIVPRRRTDTHYRPILAGHSLTLALLPQASRWVAVSGQVHTCTRAVAEYIQPK